MSGDSGRAKFHLGLMALSESRASLLVAAPPRFERCSLHLPKAGCDHFLGLDNTSFAQERA